MPPARAPSPSPRAGSARIRAAAGLLVWASGCSGASPPPSAAAPPALAPLVARLVKPPATLVIAPRGGRTAAPEETLETLARSLDAGADVLELDLHRTADGVVVCLHDATVDRTTDGSGPVAAFTWDALQELDAGHRFSPDGGATTPFRGQGLRVPSLRQVLQATPGVPLILELKQSTPPIVDDTMAVLREEGALDRVVLAAFSAETLQALRAHPDAPATSLAVTEVAAWLWAEPGAAAAPGRFLHLPPAVGPVPLIDRGLLDRAEAEGLGVHAWTLSAPDEMRALVALGVHGIMTTDPATLRAVVDGG